MTTPPIPTALVPGALLAGKYRLLRRIGEGAMGAVWAAVNEVTSGEVALKLLLRPDPELRQRLRREARAGALLKHRHILDVYDMAETAAGEPFLVMQLLSGETLSDLLARKRRLDPPLAALLARDVATALAAAHAQKIVHRDLKPANIFLHREPGEDAPFVKVLDFGVAKDLTSSDSLRTALGSVVGSLFYLSPEQARAQADIDPRADIWALGVVLFEMLTGVRPFQGDANAVFAAILNGEIPSVSKYVRHLDAALVEIVARCMRRDRDQRYASAAEVAALLQPLAGATARGSFASLPEAAPASSPASTALLAPAPGGPGAKAIASPPRLAAAGTAVLASPPGGSIDKAIAPPPRPASAPDLAGVAPGGAVAPGSARGDGAAAASAESTVTAVLSDARATPRVPGGGTVRLPPELLAQAAPPLAAQAKVAQAKVAQAAFAPPDEASTVTVPLAKLPDRAPPASDGVAPTLEGARPPRRIALVAAVVAGLCVGGAGLLVALRSPTQGAPAAPPPEARPAESEGPPAAPIETNAPPTPTATGAPAPADPAATATTVSADKPAAPPAPPPASATATPVPGRAAPTPTKPAAAPSRPRPATSAPAKPPAEKYRPETI